MHAIDSISHVGFVRHKKVHVFSASHMQYLICVIIFSFEYVDQ